MKLSAADCIVTSDQSNSVLNRWARHSVDLLACNGKNERRRSVTYVVRSAKQRLRFIPWSTSTIYCPLPSIYHGFCQYIQLATSFHAGKLFGKLSEKFTEHPALGETAQQWHAEISRQLIGKFSAFSANNEREFLPRLPRQSLEIAAVTGFSFDGFPKLWT